MRVEQLGVAAGKLTSVETSLVLGDVSIGAPPTSPNPVAFELGDGSRLALELEPALVSALLGRVLGRPIGLTAPGTPLDATTRGALSAVLIEVARLSGAIEPLTCSSAALGSDCVRVSGTVVFDGKPYAGQAWVTPGACAPSPVALHDLGELEVALPLVVGLSLASPGELATLSVGDAWLPGEGLWMDGHAATRGALAAPRSERGIAVSFSPSGAVVVGDDLIELSLDAEGNMGKDEVAGALAEAVLDSPIVVRVEVGAVSLSAREWAALRPGDVIETGRRINEPVVLRVAGREVARGELVEIDGELGVRVREVIGAGG